MAHIWLKNYDGNVPDEIIAIQDGILVNGFIDDGGQLTNQGGYYGAANGGNWNNWAIKLKHKSFDISKFKIAEIDWYVVTSMPSQERAAYGTYSATSGFTGESIKFVEYGSDNRIHYDSVFYITHQPQNFKDGNIFWSQGAGQWGGYGGAGYWFGIRKLVFKK